MDGYCVLCNGLAKYILEKDKFKSLKVASLQGLTAKSELEESQIKDLMSVIYLRDKEVLSKSSAVIYAFSDLGGWRRLAKIFLVFPKTIRDWAYQKIATNRYKWFGQKESCSLPNKDSEIRVLK